jgi:ectoine hydroxylase-related dioxygenase (phytanoyl-CoA dioxygenase family)
VTSTVSNISNRALAGQLKETFWQDGVVKLSQALDTEWLRLIELGIARNLKNPGPFAARPYAGTEREMYLDYCNYGSIPEYRILLQDSPIVDIVAGILGTTSLWLFFEQIWVKEQGLSRRTPWHQDAPSWITGGNHVAGLWITLDPLEAEESLEFVRGSHRGALYAGTALDPDDETAPAYPDSGWERTPDIEADRDAFDIVSFANQPGDAVMFHPRMLHGGGASSSPRRTLSIRFFGDDVVYEPRPGKPSPPYPGVAATLKPGDPLRSSWMPQLLPRPDRIW